MNHFFFESAERLRGPSFPRDSRGGTAGRRQAPVGQLHPRDLCESGGGRRGGGHRLLHHLHQPQGVVHQVPARGRPVEEVPRRQRSGERMGRQPHGIGRQPGTRRGHQSRQGIYPGCATTGGGIYKPSAFGSALPALVVHRSTQLLCSPRPIDHAFKEERSVYAVRA